MKILLAAILCLCAPRGAEAFLFGGASDEKARGMLKDMRINFQRGDCRAVSEISEELFREKPSAAMREEAYVYLGGCYEAQGMADKAISIYKLAYGLYPENDLFYTKLARIYLDAGFYQNAIPLFEKVLKLRSDDMAANIGLARCHAALGFLSRAKFYYSRAVVLGDLKDLELMKEYIGWMIRKRDWAEAMVIIQHAREVRPEDAQLYEALARVHAGRGEYAKAIVFMGSALKLKPADRQLALEKALMEFLAGDHEAALRSVPDGSSDGLALIIKGMAFYKKGLKKQALENLKAAAASQDQFLSDFAEALMSNSLLNYEKN